MSDDLVKRLKIMARDIEMWEKLSWGSDSALMREAADRIEELEAKLAQQDDLVQAAVDRVVWEERERGFWAGRSCGGSKAEIDAALNALCQGGE